MDAAPQKVVKPSIPAALNSIGAGGYQDIVRSETADIGELQKRKAAGQEEFKTGMGKFSEQRADIGKAQESELGALGAQPKPPVDKFEFHAKDASELGGLLMLLGALGGRNTLQPMTASLNNLTAVMKGQQQGDQLAYTRAADEFKKNFDIGMAKFKEYEQGRKDILAKHKGDMAGLDQEMRHYELMHKGEVSQWDAEIRSRKDRGNAEKAALDAQQRAERLDKTFSLKEKEASGGVKLTDDAQDFFSKVESLGGVPLKFSGRKEAVSAEIELKNKAVKYMRENNITPSQYIANKDIQKSVATAMTALTKVATGQDKMAKKFMGDYEALIELAKTNAAGGNARILNAPINQMRSLFSDPEIKTLAIQADLAATEFERIIQGGALSTAQLHEGARVAAEKLLNKDMTLKEFIAIYPVLQGDIKRAIDANNYAEKSLIEKIKNPSGAVKSGIPDGSEVIGHTPDGKEVHRSPDGRKWVE